MWTVEEARRYLPRLRHLLAVVRRAGVVAVAARHNGHAGAAGPGPAPGPVDAVGDPVDPAGAVRELRAGAIVVRDLERGLVDFPARHGGRTVLLCWLEGEEDLAWWHYPEDGFAGRRPLPLPPEGPPPRA